MSDLQNILNLVDEYIKEKKSKETWIPGKDYVKYAGPYFDSDEYIAAVNTLLKGWLVLGDDAVKFERKFPKYFGKEHGVLVNSGSSANLLMMEAMRSRNGFRFPEGTKVLVPIAGFPATLTPIFQVNFKPVFVDIELDTLNLDLDQVEKILSEEKDIRIITFAHVLGNPPNMDKLMYIIEKYKLVLLEDCCDALGSTYDGKYLGSFGEMASCSMYPAHFISTLGEGGFVSTKTKELEMVVRNFREWGRSCYCVGPKANTLKCGTCKNRFSNWVPAFPDEIFDHKYVYSELGYNMKPIEVQASVGLAQLKKLDEILLLRRCNYYLFYKIYKKYEEFFILPKPTEKSNPAWFAFPLTIKPNVPFKRTEIVDYLEDHKIQTRPYFAGNIMLQPAYSHMVDQNAMKINYPNATYSMLNTFFHGVSPVITKEQIEYIGEVVDNFIRKF